MEELYLKRYQVEGVFMKNIPKVQIMGINYSRTKEKDASHSFFKVTMSKQANPKESWRELSQLLHDHRCIHSNQSRYWSSIMCILKD